MSRFFCGSISITKSSPTSSNSPFPLSNSDGAPSKIPQTSHYPTINIVFILHQSSFCSCLIPLTQSFTSFAEHYNTNLRLASRDLTRTRCERRINKYAALRWCYIVNTHCAYLCIFYSLADLLGMLEAQLKLTPGQVFNANVKSKIRNFRRRIRLELGLS